MLYFCTYFDRNYLIKGLALYRSLVRNVKVFNLWILCLDDLTYGVLQQLAFPEIKLISLNDFENGDKELLQAKTNRSKIEYYFTCTPFLPLYVLRNYLEVDLITYLDADLFFFSNPSPIYQEVDKGSVAIIGHRFPPPLKHLEKFGIYNVSFLSFRRDEAGLQCLRWFRERCLEWCYDREEEGCYADQKYLDDWPTRFPGVIVLQHKGAGLGPWNIGNYLLSLKKRQISVDSQPLIFFHFHGLEQVSRWAYDPKLTRYRVYTNFLLKRRIYGPYIKELQKIGRSERICKSHNHISSIRDGNRKAAAEKNNIFRRNIKKIKQLIYLAAKVSQGSYYVVINKIVL